MRQVYHYLLSNEGAPHIMKVVKDKKIIMYTAIDERDNVYIPSVCSIMLTLVIILLHSI